MDFIELKNKVNGFLYSKIAKPVLFLFDPEVAHKLFVFIGKVLGSNPLTRGIVSGAYNYRNKKLEQNILGINFKNPIGLAAGFDKNAELISVIESVGFGFSEVGSITAKECKGNSGKRLSRIINQKSLWIYFGLNNRGADRVFEGLEKKKYKIPFGVNVAKTNCQETTDPKIGLQDYIYSVKKFRNTGEYIVLNISCPNSFGGEDFSNPELYSKLLREVDRLRLKKPVFVKLSPDLSREKIDRIIKISGKHRISGFICTNLTKRHKIGKGGLSGKALEKMSDDLLKYVYKRTKGKFVLIGAGGVFSAEDAYRKIKYGASLVQLITGMIYKGPSLIGEINYGLAKLLEKEGYNNISEAVGKGT